MSVYSIPVTLGIDEEQIIKTIEADVEKQVVSNITKEIKQRLYKPRSYYSDKYDDSEPMLHLIRGEISRIIEQNKDVIIQKTAEVLAEKLVRTKAVKEAALDVVNRI